MSVDVEEFLAWVQHEHGKEARLRVERRLEPDSTDPAEVLRMVLIELHPDDYEVRPAMDALPYGFCST